MRSSLLLALGSYVALGTLFIVSGCGRETGSSTQSTTPKSVDRLNSLARGELAALETYRQAIAKEGSAALRLGDLRREHEEASAQLAARVRSLGGTPPTDSGAWGDFAKALEGTAKVLGNDAAMSALRMGEEQGTRSYESALEDGDLDAGSKDLIRNTLLPRQRTHAAAVQTLIDAPAGPPATAPGR